MKVTKKEPVPVAQGEYKLQNGKVLKAQLDDDGYFVVCHKDRCMRFKASAEQIGDLTSLIEACADEGQPGGTVDRAGY